MIKKEWHWMDTKVPLSFIRDEMKWVEQVITHKDNKNLHYPALKQLINNFHNKWLNNNNKVIMNIYREYLNSVLRSEFGR